MEIITHDMTVFRFFIEKIISSIAAQVSDDRSVFLHLSTALCMRAYSHLKLIVVTVSETKIRGTITKKQQRPILENEVTVNHFGGIWKLIELNTRENSK